MIEFISTTSNIPFEFINGVYLHGEVEYFFNYDCVGINNKDELIEGIHTVKVHDYPNECKLFCWKSKISSYKRGLIVDPLNIDDLKFAEHHYNKRSHII